MNPDKITQMQAEVDKLLAVTFIEEVKYPRWVSDIVPATKKNGKIRVCTYFTNLNKA